ncbi:MAG: hypothetical protein IJS56_06630 [Bacilli bacterium]|nr:hypothetical protein [Bacilli bacterium]
MKESSKNILIFFLSLIFIGLIGLLIYSYDYQKKLLDDVPEVKKQEEVKKINVVMNEKNINLELKEVNKNIDVYFNNKKITSVIDGTLSNNVIEVFKSNEVDYLILGIYGHDFKPIILNSEGIIIYEFDTFNYTFIDDNNHKNIFVDNNNLFVYNLLNDEDKLSYSETEYARKNQVNIIEENVTFEFLSIEHGKLN